MRTDAAAGAAPHARRGGAVLVAAGILLSRISGFVRLRAFAYYFGLHADAADAFNAAFRIPNVLQNLFGEGALSASFIPVYASLLKQGEGRDADRVAGAVASVLALVVALFVLVGVVAAPLLIAVIAPGFTGEKRALTVTLVRVLFPGAGLLVMSAWCLGVLNSHGRFMLSYTAPVMWNAAMVVALLTGGHRLPLASLAVVLAWASVAGSALQCAVQLPVVFRVASDLRFSIVALPAHVTVVIRNFVPVLTSRGVVQLSAYIDSLLASLLPTGAVTGLTNAQILYTLPVSLFGMSVAAAELPAMSALNSGDEAGAAALRTRLDAGLRQIAFFVVPSAVAFLTLGDVIAAAVLQTGRFDRADSLYVWGILAGSSVGLLASTLGRLYASTYFALRDTRTPLRYALVRVALTTVLGYLFSIVLPPMLGVPMAWGVAGLTASAGLAAWVEMLLLRHTMKGHIGPTGLAAGYVVQLWVAALMGSAVAWGIKWALPPYHPVILAGLTLVPYGAVFFGMMFAWQVPEASALMRRVRRRRQP